MLRPTSTTRLMGLSRGPGDAAAAGGAEGPGVAPAEQTRTAETACSMRLLHETAARDLVCFNMHSLQGPCSSITAESQQDPQAWYHCESKNPE